MKAPTLSVKTEYEERSLKVTFAMDEAEVRPGWSTKFDYQPTGGQITYSLNRSSDVRLFGPKLKKDGTPGQVGHTERFWHDTDVPDWLSAFIDANRPEWAK